MRPRLLLAAALATGFLASACGGGTPSATDTGTPSPSETESPPEETESPSPDETDGGGKPPREVEGLIVQLIGGGEAGFVLDADRRYRILLDPDVDYGEFDAHHLEEHAQEGSPVAVKLRERGGKLYATKISDA